MADASAAASTDYDLSAEETELNKSLFSRLEAYQTGDHFAQWSKQTHNIHVCQNAKNLKERLRNICAHVYTQILLKFEGDKALNQGTTFNKSNYQKQAFTFIKNEFLPRTVPLKQLYAAYAMLQALQIAFTSDGNAATGLDAETKSDDDTETGANVSATPAKGQTLFTLESWSKKVALHCTANKHSPVFIRESYTSVYVTFTTSAATYTYVLASLTGTSYRVLFDILRSSSCNWFDRKFQTSFASFFQEWKSHGVSTDSKSDFVALLVQHKDNLYNVSDMQQVWVNIDPPAKGRGTLGGGSEPQAFMPTDDEENLSNFTRYLMQHLQDKQCHIMSWSEDYCPPIPDMSPISYVTDVFTTRNVLLDEQYKRYCDAYAQSPLVNGTIFMRDMQIQERMLALAGLMASRYDNPSTFAAKMSVTARVNAKPMDIDETIRTLAQLDVRQGLSVYSKYVRAPSSTQEPADVLSCLPIRKETWDNFASNFVLLESKLEA